MSFSFEHLILILMKMISFFILLQNEYFFEMFYSFSYFFMPNQNNFSNILIFQIIYQFAIKFIYEYEYYEELEVL